MAEDQAGNIESVEEVRIEEQMLTSYLDYAMSVIVGRAFPDARDGLKPVQRRILYTMWEEGIRANTQYKKSARAVGNVLAKYHPHGELAVYDALVRMAQPFSLRYPLVDGQGNFGCFIGSTRVRLADGTARSFVELVADAEQGKDHFVYAVDAAGRVVMAPLRSPRLTKQGVPVVKVTLDDGEEIVCTPDHRFMLRDGTYREAQDLQPDVSLMPLYTRIYEGADRDMRWVSRGISRRGETLGEFAHRLADEFNIEPALAHTAPESSGGISGASRARRRLRPHGRRSAQLRAGGRCLRPQLSGQRPCGCDALHGGTPDRRRGRDDGGHRQRDGRVRRQRTPPSAAIPLPARLPNLLLNGAEGIAVGMATKIPPHNLTELVDGITLLIDHPDAAVDDLLQFVRGPDFPTAGLILGMSGIRNAYATGRGRVVMRAPRRR